MPVRAVFDANVLISGLVFEGLPGECLDAISTGQVECVVCAAILGDVAEKLAIKFHHSDEQLADEIAWLVHHARVIEPPGQLHGVSRDPDDDIVVECALIAGAALIVTGDADLLQLKRYQSVTILRPVEFLAVIRAENG